MSRYAVKIGEIHLTADGPLTQEDVRMAVEELTADPSLVRFYIEAGCVELRLDVQRGSKCATK